MLPFSISDFGHGSQHNFNGEEYIQQTSAAGTTADSNNRRRSRQIVRPHNGGPTGGGFDDESVIDQMVQQLQAATQGLPAGFKLPWQKHSTTTRHP